MSEYRLKQLQMLTNVDYVLYHQEQFIDLNVSKLNHMADKIATNLNSIYASARACYRGVSGCEFPTSIEVIDLQLPKRVETSKDSTAEEQLKKEQQAKTAAIEQQRLAQERQEKALKDLKAAQDEARRQEEATAKAIALAAQAQADAQRAIEEAKRQQQAADTAKAQAEQAQREATKRAAAAAANLVRNGPEVFLLKRLVH